MTLVPNAPEKIICKEGDQTKHADIRFLAFNDVYHLEPDRNHLGGVTRFQTLCKSYQHQERFADEPEIVTFFSGDGFGPSLESSVTKGQSVCIEHWIVYGLTKI